MSKLFCSIVNTDSYLQLVEILKSNYDIFNNRIFIYNILETDKQFITFSGLRKLDGINFNLITIHRKSEYNVFYTINALNRLIVINNNGLLDTKFQIDWSLYRDKCILTENNNLNILNIQFKQLHYIN